MLISGSHICQFMTSIHILRTPSKTPHNSPQVLKQNTIHTNTLNHIRQIIEHTKTRHRPLGRCLVFVCSIICWWPPLTLLTHLNDFWIFSVKTSEKETKAGFQIGEAMKTNVSLKCVSLISGCLKPEHIHNVGLEKLFWTRFAICPRVTGSG